MPQITVLTPTYNRATLLPRLYESLCCQTCKDFEWIVVDDGSADGTKDVVAQLNTAAFPIRYYQKCNGGKHTAVNLGVKQAEGTLLFIADSDDMLLPASLADVVKAWQTVQGNRLIAGIAGFDVSATSGEIIGSGLPSEVIDCNAMDIRYKFHVKGDLKEVFRTDVLREFPFPEVKDERFCPEQLCWFRIAQKYVLRYINRPLYIADYQPEGISAGITKARMQSPVASTMTYAEMLAYDIPVREKLKAAVNYWRFRACAATDKMQQIPQIPAKWSWTRPLGWLMHLGDVRQCAAASSVTGK